MIGQFTIPGTSVVCTLDDELQWQAPQPTKDMLNDLFSPLEPEYSSPSLGEPGYLALSEAAEAFGAVAEFEPIPEGDPDAVF